MALKSSFADALNGTLRMFILTILVVVSASQNTFASTSRCEALFVSDYEVLRAELARVGLDELQKLAKNDSQAIEVLQRLLLDKKQMEAEVKVWLEELRLRPLSVLEHSALAFLYRNVEFVEALAGNSNLSAQFSEILGRSWINLTGSVPAKLGDRLPERILKRQDKQTRIFEESSQQPLSGAENVSRKTMLTDIRNNLERFLVAPGLLMMASAFSATGGKAIAGAITGFLVVSVVEHLAHRFIGHTSINSKIAKIQSEKTKAFIQKFKFLTDYMEKAWVSHTLIHHGATFNSSSGGYNRQFLNAEHQDAVDKTFLAMGYEKKRLDATGYGVSLDPQARFAFMAIVTPFQLAISALTGFDPVFTASAVAMGFYFQFNSADMHPYLHMKRKEAMQKASPLMRWYLGTSFMEKVSVHHFVHHRAQVNYNLTPFSIGDWIHERLRTPNMVDFLKMHRLELIGANWDQPDVK